MKLVNEKTALTLKASYRGDDGSILTPTTLKYRMDCETTGQSITPWTTLTPAAVTSIPISAANNAILDDSNSYEDRSVLVMIDEGLATQEVTEQKYRVKNLGGLP